MASKQIGHDFIANPELAKDPKWAVEILFKGMEEGWFTGRSFDDYIDDVDESADEDLREFTNARGIINGRDKAGLIAGYALKFQTALIAADYGVQAPIVPKLEPKVPGLDKPMVKSKTLWGTIVSFVSATFAAFGGLDWRVQLALLAVVAVAGWLIVSDRVKYRDIARRLGL